MVLSLILIRPAPIPELALVFVVVAVLAAWLVSLAHRAEKQCKGKFEMVDQRLKALADIFGLPVGKFVELPEAEKVKRGMELLRNEIRLAEHLALEFSVAGSYDERCELKVKAGEQERTANNVKDLLYEFDLIEDSAAYAIEREVRQEIRQALTKLAGSL